MMLGNEGPKREVRWPVLRVEAGTRSEVVLLSARWLHLQTHFHKRTQLCLGDEGCPVCAFLPSRGYYYLPAAFCSTRRPVLLELSPLASADLEQNARLTEQGMRSGLVVAFTRRSARAPLRSEVLEQGPVRGTLADWEWYSAVMGIYGFGAMRPDESVEDYRERLRPSAVSRAERLAAELRGKCQTSSRDV